MGKLSYSRKVYLFPGSKVELKIHTFCLGFLFCLMEHQTQYLDSDSHTHSDNLHWTLEQGGLASGHTQHNNALCVQIRLTLLHLLHSYISLLLCVLYMYEGRLYLFCFI